MSTLIPALSSRRISRNDSRLRDFALIFGAVFFLALSAQVKIPLPFTPVPLSGQSFAVLLVGALLGAKRGALSLSLYLVAGGLGLPVFVGGNAGLAYLSGLTFGYLLGFVLAAYVVGKLTEISDAKTWRALLFPFLAGTLLIYFFGAGWMALSLGVEKALLLGVLPFLFGDLVKMLFAALLFSRLRKD